MNHAQLRAFHAVAEYGGFTSAAQALGLTQPALTLQVKALEQRYKTKLFNRKGRRIEITPSGARLLKLSTRIFSLEEEAHSLLSSLENLEAGQLKVSAPSSLNTLPILSRFSDKYPAVDLNFQLVEPDEIEEHVLDCRTDIGFMRYRPKNPRLFSYRLSEDDVKLAVSYTHPWTSRHSISEEDIGSIKIIVPKNEGNALKEPNHWSNYIQVSREQTVILENKEIGREAVANNLGAAFLTEMEVSGDNRIHLIDIEGREMVSETYITFLKENESLRIISSFYGLAKQSLAQSRQT